ncbi:MAG: D-alanine--D-alanine ligase [Eubacteriales bacterium]
MKILVLAGGFSMERHVSLTSGAMVSQALRKNGHTVAMVDLYFDVEKDFSFLSKEKIPENYFQVNTEIPDLESLKKTKSSENFIGNGVISLCHQADLVFLALHGSCGEDGRLQAVLDLEGICYTGSGHLPSALAMDKNLTKLFIQGEIPTAPWKKMKITEKNIKKLAKEISLPIVVKPINSGSSIGVSIPNNMIELETALADCLALGGEVILEEFISGREIQVAILGDRTLPPIEIFVEDGFYDLENKYKSGLAKEVCPADIPADIAEKLSNYAMKAFQILGLSVIARADFILAEDGTIYFLEINTLPGMTPTSLVPQEAAAVGISYDALCEQIVTLSLEK